MSKHAKTKSSIVDFSNHLERVCLLRSLVREIGMAYTKTKTKKTKKSK